MTSEARRLPRAAALIFRRSLYAAIPLATIVGLTAGAYAAIQTFTAGGKVSAAEMNGNFADLNSRLAAVEAKGGVVTLGTKKYSVGATTYKASTSGLYSGSQVGGYDGAKAKCEIAVGNATAHLCTFDELSRSAQLGVSPIVVGYYSASLVVYNSQAADDCGGWTDSSGTQDGSVWALTPSRPSVTTCNSTKPLLCCD